MRPFIILFLMFLFKISNGQDTIRHYEFGSTLVTFNPIISPDYFAPDRPDIELINGLFFRYSKKRLGLRALLSYSENYKSYNSPSGWSDGFSGDLNNKDFRIGLGGQFSIPKHKDWLYTFIDLSYRNLFSTGHRYGGISGSNDKFTKTANGLDSFFGLGFKIKTFRNIYLSPESGYNICYKLVTSKSTSMTFGQTQKSNYTETIGNPYLKLHLSAKF